MKTILSLLVALVVWVAIFTSYTLGKHSATQLHIETMRTFGVKCAAFGYTAKEQNWSMIQTTNTLNNFLQRIQ